MIPQIKICITSLIVLSLLLSTAGLYSLGGKINSDVPIEPHCLSVPLNQPMQGATPAVNWSSFPSPPAQSLAYECVELADMNLDGKLDIVGGYDNQGIHIWIGNGTGNWTSMTSPTNLFTFHDIAVGDINNDGKLDIVGASSNGLHGWTGDGTGNWVDADPGEALPITGIYYGITLDDVNLDGNLDIICTTMGLGPNIGVKVFLGDGAGGWTEGSTNLPNGTYYGIATDDFNKDGNPDIVAACSAGVKAWEGDGTGSWTLRDNGLARSGSYSDVKFADFNLDGNLDIVAAGDDDNGLTVWNGDGWGIWTMTFNLPFTGSYTGVEVGDLNIDGYIDILTSSSNSNDTIWTGDGADQWYLQTSGLLAEMSSDDIAIGDMNNDARMEICLINSTGINIWSSSVERTVNSWAAFPAPPSALAINDIEVFDVNQDGKQDICYATTSNGIEVWTGDGTGICTSFTSPVTTGTYNSVESTDLDHDGNPDIIATWDSGIYAWAGDSIGGWTARNTGLPTEGKYLGLATADFNDDGNPDIAAGSDGSGVTVWNGDGWGIWTMTFNLPFAGTYYDLSTGDVNHDGNIDIIAADGGLKVFLGDSNDGWTEASTGLPDNTNQYYSFEIADLNNDGKTDIVGASEIAGVNTWLGDGSGSWALDSNVVLDASRGLAIGDFSIDGSKDVITGSSLDAGLNGNEQNGGSWNTVSHGLFQAGDFTTIELADINIDGRLDIITANYTAGTPHIWVGQDITAPPSSYNIGPLQVDWNMISLPLVPENSTMPDVLIDLDGDTSWSRVMLYESLDPTDPWKSYAIAKPASLQQVSDIHNKNGIWVLIPDAGSLGDGFIRIEGQEPTTTIISLNTGWNLVGYPSMTPEIAVSTLPASADMISVFDAGQPYLIRDEVDLSLVTMNDGEAYWVHVTADAIWNVNWD